MILEEFEGFTDKFEGDIAHITLTAVTGEKFYIEYPIAKLPGINERRRFLAKIIETDDIQFVVEPIPDKQIDEDAIDRLLDGNLQ